MPTLWGIEDVAAYLRVPVDTIYAWRVKRYGPPGHRVGKYVRFIPADVEQWVRDQAEDAA